MFTPEEAPVQHLPFAQAIELSLLVDLEARWENLRIYQTDTPGMPTTLKDLQRKQKAYEAFLAKLVVYNKAHKPAHVAELLLNNATRLGKWCWSMRDLIRQVQNDTRTQCPADLLAKAYRWADRVADRLKKDRVTRAAPSITLAAAIQELEDLAQWCDRLSRVAS